MNEGWRWFEGVGWSVILVEGADGLDLLQRLTTNDVKGLAAGECRRPKRVQLSLTAMMRPSRSSTATRLVSDDSTADSTP